LLADCLLNGSASDNEAVGDLLATDGATQRATALCLLWLIVLPVKNGAGKAGKSERKSKEAEHVYSSSYY